ncbi:MAG TPA: HD domain-containing phosphohydrolase [Burkholderiaceae bacterium]|nr:HD domain-containing phosphohydrolase [Burkholderiaceae bacterium]
MTAPAHNDSFLTANQHALATILEASQTKSIIASRDIFDIAGIKLWARDQPVSGALQRKLLDRQLRNPLESCLLAEDGVTSQTLVTCTEELLARDTPLSALLRSQALKVMPQVAHLPLHSVAQLLLTAGQASRPDSFDHAVRAMALAGALMAAHGGGTAELRQAMLGGLLHDLGEMYIDPRYGEADANRSLDFISYQQLVVHPHVGQLLVAQLTNYPGTVCRAIAEHHERLDGSGYPHGLRRDDVSPLGRLLAVVEAALGALRHDGVHLSRASVALRVVPDEFDLSWVGSIADSAREAGASQVQSNLGDVKMRLGRLDAELQAAHDATAALAGEAESPALKNALALALHLLGRLRAGWYSSGLWSTECVGMQNAAEADAMESELLFRLRSIERATRLRAGELAADEAQALNVLCQRLSGIDG